MDDKEKNTIPCGSSGTQMVYFVEVRSGTPHPVELHGKWYGQEWSWYLPGATCMTPSALYREHEAHGLLPYEKAMAIAYAVVAESHSFASRHSIGLEVRVVEAKASWSYSAERRREFEPLQARPPQPATREGREG